MLIQKQYKLVNFSGNWDQAGNTAMFFIIEEAKETILDYLQRTIKVLFTLFCFNIIQNDSV